MRILFFGSSDYSYAAFKVLPQEEIVAIITQPDRKGRKGKTETFLKEKTKSSGIPIFQPENIKESFNLIKDINPDLIITAAYGQILPKSILDYPKYGAVNIHASLLPKYKGASPIRQVILNDEKETGLTSIFMNENIDEGDILCQQSIPIVPEETYSSLYNKILETVPEFMLYTLKCIKEGQKGTKQEKVDSYSGKITLKDGFIKWEDDCEEICRTIRAFANTPGATASIDDKTIKIYQAKPLDIYHDNIPGQIIRFEKDFFRVSCGKGYIDVYEVQLPGKKIMPAKDFINGNKQWLNNQIKNKKTFE